MGQINKYYEDYSQHMEEKQKEIFITLSLLSLNFLIIFNYRLFLSLFILFMIIQIVYNNQLSTTPNSDNRVSHNYFIDALEDLIDGLDYAILGVESGDSYYIELGILYIEDAGTNAELATLALEGC